MTAVLPDPPKDPILTLPVRVPGSVRRTMHVDVGPRAEWGSALPVYGAARDLRTNAKGDPEIVAVSHIHAGFDKERRMVEIEADPPADWLVTLLGIRAGGGFRQALGELVPPEEAGSLVRQVLDDMPAALLISGYALMRWARRRGADPRSLTPRDAVSRMVGICSGWRSGGAAADSLARDEGVPLEEATPARVPIGLLEHPMNPSSPDGRAAFDLGSVDPALLDPWAWHDMPVLPVDQMRRRRSLDLQVHGDGTFEVWAMFRDSVGEPDGDEAVVHEYTVRANGVDGVLARVEAEPRVLPFPECPLAAAHVNDLVGLAVADLASAVPETLTDIRSCTHLNDLLRALGGLASLFEAAAATH